MLTIFSQIYTTEKCFGCSEKTQKETQAREKITHVSFGMLISDECLRESVNDTKFIHNVEEIKGQLVWFH